MAITVAELLELLQDVDPTAEVRLAVQPSWPFENEIDSVITAKDVIEAVEVVQGDLGEDDEEVEWEPLNVVYLTDGGQIGYLDPAVRMAWNLVRED